MVYISEEEFNNDTDLINDNYRLEEQNIELERKNIILEKMISLDFLDVTYCVKTPSKGCEGNNWRSCKPCVTNYWEEQAIQILTAEGEL